MSLKTFLEKILPFLFNAVEKEFDNLPKGEQDALINEGQFGQIIKTEFSKGYAAVEALAVSKLGMTPDGVNTSLIALAKKLSIPATTGAEFITGLQSKVTTIVEDSEWDSFWHNVSGQLMIIAGGGTISWPTLAMGLIQLIYDKFVKPKL